MRTPRNFTGELYEFIDSHKIKLIGDYPNVKKTTMIHFHCKCCNVPIKKSYKYLTEGTGLILTGICHKCIRVMCH